MRRIKSKKKTTVILAFVLASFLLIPNQIAVYSAETDNTTTSLLELNIEIEKKRKSIEELQKQTKAYQNNIEQTQEEAASLTNQLLVIDDQMGSTATQIEITEIQIDKLDLEIQNLELRIQSKTDEINLQKKRISELLRKIHRADQKTYLEITLSYDKFSDFFNQLKFLKETESQNKDLLDRYKQLKTDYEGRKGELAESQKEFVNKQTELELTKSELDYQNSFKTDLLAQTQNSEEKFRDILDELRDEQLGINSELNSLEQLAKEKLELEDIKLDLGDGSGILSWPVSPAGGITAYFHDPTYPYRYIF
ncbi:hypothetical protein KKI23_03240, partial [Patescibacteria group bacterium]|nr:hypothetical protein [Patescibacteria group bacterium]